MPTIATHLGTDVSRAHNRRDRSVTDKEKHIDPQGLFEIWLDRDTKQMYEEEFGEALAEYNAKQKRNDRKIDSYYDHICNSQKQHVEYEMIIGIYRDKDECGRRIGPEIPLEDSRAIIRATYERMLQENSHARFTSASFHADEPGAEAHAHITMFFVADGYKNGLRKQASLDRALTQQGDKGTGYSRTAQIAWEARMNAIMREEAEKRGYTINRPMAGKGAVHLSTEAYKARCEALEATEARDTAQGEYEALQAKITALEASEQAAVARADKAEKEAQAASERLVEAEKKLERAERIIKRGKPSWADKQFSAEAVANAQKLIAEAGSITAAAESKERVASAREEELNKKAKLIQDVALNLNVEKVLLKQQKQEAEQERNIAQRLFARAWNGLKDWLQPMIEEAASRQNNRLRRWLEKNNPDYLAQIDAELMSRNLDELIRDAESIPGSSTGHQTGRGIRDDDVR